MMWKTNQPWQRAFALLSVLFVGGALLACTPQVKVLKSKRSKIFDLVRQLRASSTADRVNAAQSLGEMGPKARRAIPKLRLALDDPSLEVRKASLRALMATGKPGIPSWLRGLNDKSDQIKQMVKERLDQGGDEIIEDVAGVLQSPIELERQLAVRALGYMSKRSQKAIPALGKAVLDSEVDVRQEAAQMLGSLGSRAAPAVPQLIKGLQTNRDWWRVRKAVIEALGSIGPAASPATTRLVEMIQDKDDDVRKAALRAIRQIGPAAVRALSDALPSSTWWAKAEILKTLERFGMKAKGALPALITLLEDQDNDVRRRSARIIGTLGPQADAAAPALGKILNSQKSPHTLWMVVMKSLMKLGPKGQDVLRQALNSTEWWLPKTISEALGSFGADTGPEALPLLKAALLHKRWEVRWTATLVVGKMKGKASSLIPQLLQALKDKEEKVQIQAAFSLGAMGSDAKSAIKTLQSLRNSGSLKRRAAIKKALEKIDI